jgi:methanogenic corrinoid protein MtbC1
MAQILEELAGSLLEYDPVATVGLVQKALDEGHDANEILKKG